MHAADLAHDIRKKPKYSELNETRTEVIPAMH